MQRTADSFNSLRREEKRKSNVIITNHYASNTVVFLDAKELSKKLGWSMRKVFKLFNDPEFPSSDYGKKKVVEMDALKKYFSVKRERKDSEYWMEVM